MATKDFKASLLSEADFNFIYEKTDASALFNSVMSLTCDGGRIIKLEGTLTDIFSEFKIDAILDLVLHDSVSNLEMNTELEITIPSYVSIDFSKLSFPFSAGKTYTIKLTEGFYVENDPDFGEQPNPAGVLTTFEVEYAVFCNVISELTADVIGIFEGITNATVDTTFDVGNITLFRNANSNMLVSSNFNYDELLSNYTVNRSYKANDGNSIFSSNPLQLSSNLDSGENYELLLTSGNGEFTLGNNTLYNELSITGSISYINSQIQNVEYWPDKNFRGTDTLTYTLKTDTGNLLERYSTNVNYTGDAVVNEEFEFTTSALNYEFDLVYQKYYNSVDMLLVGGGASGWNLSSDGSGASEGAGGGGGVLIKSDLVIDFTQSHNLIVGAEALCNKSNWPGAVQGVDGNDTSAFGYVAAGGLSGDGVKSGDSGYPSTSGTFYRNTGSTYGGAAGAGEDGFDNVVTQDPYSFDAGNGGDGLSFTLFGETLPKYGAGGGGNYSTGSNATPGFGGWYGGGNGSSADPYDTDIGGGNYYPGEDGLPNTGGGGGSGSASHHAGDIGNGAPGNGAAGFIRLKVKL